MKQNNPKWVNPARQVKLIDLWKQYGNQCLLGHKTCPIREHYRYTERYPVLVAKPILQTCVDRDGMPQRDKTGELVKMTVYRIEQTTASESVLTRLYDVKETEILRYWRELDRIQRQADYEAEYQARHKTNDRTLPLHGKFSGVSQDIWHDTQPEFQIEAIGYSAIKKQPFVKVRLSGSFIRLHVDLGNTLRLLSKSRRRKVIRYGKPIPENIRERVESLAWLAVKNYRNM